MLLAVGGARTAPGDLDPSFGGDGIVTPGNNGAGLRGGGMVVQTDGKLVIGAGSFIDATAYDFMLARFNADGSLDSNFGDGGIVTTAFGPNHDVVHGLALQADGKIVAVGETDGPLGQEFALARYNPDGSLDTSFSVDGKVTIDLAAWAESVALQPDGKIVCVGGYRLVRLNVDGTPDPTFGSGGIVATAIGAFDVAIQADNRLVIAGIGDINAVSALALARYHANGSLDASFGDNGIVRADFGNLSEGHTVTLQPDGKIVAAGLAGGDFALARYHVNGSLDTSFSGDGLVTTDFGRGETAHAIAVEPGGKIVAGGQSGWSTSDFALARYLPDGSLDTTFSGDGLLTMDFYGEDDWVFTVAVQADDRILAFGAYMRSPGDSYALARYVGGDDVTEPETTIEAGPQGFTNDPTPTFAFSSSEGGSTFECRVDTGSYTACGSPHTTDPLIDGPHTFAVRAIDRSLNRDPTPAGRSFTVDTVVPETTITDGPAGATNDPTPTLVFSSSEPEATLSCRVDSGAFATCSSPYTTAVLADGTHTFAVYASDAAGNADATPASRFFVVDTTAPETVLEEAPSGPTNDATPTFVFSSEQGASFSCRFASDAFRPCSSPHTPGVLVDGMYTFEIRATDLVGNTDATPAGATWTIDTKVPAFTLSGKRSQKVGRRLIVSVRAVSEHVWATVSGRISIRAPVRSLKGPRNKLVTRGRTVLIPLYMPGRAQTAIRLALRRGKVVRGTVTVRGRDLAGNVRTRRLTIKITR